MQRLRTDDEIAPIYVRKVAQQAPFNYKVPFNYDLDELLLLNIGCSRRDLIELRSKDTLLKAMKLAIKFYNLEDEPVSIFPKKKTIPNLTKKVRKLYGTERLRGQELTTIYVWMILF